MKNSKVWLGLVIIGVVSAANGLGEVYIVNELGIKTYLTGSKIDENGRTLSHLFAENCDNLRRFNFQVIVETDFLEFSEGKLPVSENNPSIFTKDKNGETPLDIAKRMYRKTKHTDCADMMLEFMEQEAVEKSKE